MAAVVVAATAMRREKESLGAPLNVYERKKETVHESTRNKSTRRAREKDGWIRPP